MAALQHFVEHTVGVFAALVGPLGVFVIDLGVKPEGMIQQYTTRLSCRGLVKDFSSWRQPFGLDK